MKHCVRFNNIDNHWDNALPFGNGVFGCMTFFERRNLHIPMNHYEVYYNISDAVLPEDILRKRPDCDDPGALHRDTKARADRNAPNPGEPHCLYRTDRKLAFQEKPYGIAEASNTYPQTGELVYSFADSMKDASSDLTLYVEDARGELILRSQEKSVSVQTIVTRRDCILNEIAQSEAGLVSRLKIYFPTYRSTGANAPIKHILDDTQPADYSTVDIRYEQPDPHTVLYTVTRKLSDAKTFTFSGILRFENAEVESGNREGNSLELTIRNAGTNFRVYTAIFTDWHYEDTRAAALSGIDELQNQCNTLIAEHHDYWKQFFTRSSISLPDPFLEKVYVINQYALDCCSGKDGVMKHHACGLNGLWAVRHPNIWGSMWYWDVNIQAAFAGVFSSNRLDLAHVFSDGLRSYMKLGEKSAHDVHGLSGIASDYPYNFYYSCWTWCAQYLWFLYEYSLDETYLRNEAYPLFLKLCEFTLGIFEYDEASDTYNVYPDICPEQGPLSHNTTITVSCAKYLFEFTLKAAEILGDASPMLEQMKAVSAKLPAYALTGPGKYGVHYKDSPDAPDNLWLRHPSLLMPVFPIGEIGIHSDETTKEYINNTIDYLEDRCEIGIFGGSWIAAAAARMGRGQTALRLLYERGIDHMLRSNGLSAEDTDHFINFCLMSRQPLYYPCMMEFTGEMLAAVNEMLLQSHGGLIRVFPALPNGVRDYGRAVRNGESISDYTEIYTDYDAWRTARFDRLLAKGAFEVSASVTDSSLDWILIHSQKGSRVSVTSPLGMADLNVFCENLPVEFTCADGVISFLTEAGKDYLIAASADKYTVNTGSDTYDEGIALRKTYTRRKISIGADDETEYWRKLDRYTRDWYVGNVRLPNRTIYKFDFTEQKSKKYASFFPLQTYENQGHHLNSMDFIRMNAVQFTPEIGVGFENPVGVVMGQSDAPDALRQDFVQSDRDAVFTIDAPRGQYEVILVSGDGNEDSVTIAQSENTRRIGGKNVKAGQYQCEMIPVIQEYDEPIRIKLSTVPGYRWKLNFLILNLVKEF